MCTWKINENEIGSCILHEANKTQTGLYYFNKSINKEECFAQIQNMSKFHYQNQNIRIIRIIQIKWKKIKKISITAISLCVKKFSQREWQKVFTEDSRRLRQE